MVLRLILIFTLFVTASTTYARKSNKNFKRAQILFKKKQYSKSLKSLRRGYNFRKTKRIPPPALFLISLNYHKLGNHQKSIFYFNRLIKNIYMRKHVRVMRALKKDEVDEMSIPRTLNSTYFYLAQSHYKLYSKSENIAEAKKAKKFFKICDDTDFNDRCADFIENLDEKIKYNKNKKKGYEFFVYGGRFLFQDRITLKNSSDGNEDDLIANNSTICYGAGIRRGNAFKGYQVSGCVLSGTASIKNHPGSVQAYSQSGIPVAGLLVEGGYYIKLDQQKTRLGVSLPVMYRSGVYTQPEGFTIPDSKSFNFGLMGSAGLQLPIIELELKLGHMQMANLLMINGVYNF